MTTPPEPAKQADSARPLLEVRNLHMQFPIKRGLLRRTVGFVSAVNDVSFSIRPGETLSLVGESGCGKTTTGRCIVRVYNPTSGQILYQLDEQERVDLAQYRQPRTATISARDPHDLPGPLFFTESAPAHSSNRRRAPQSQSHRQRIGVGRPRCDAFAPCWIAPRVHSALSACFQWRRAPADRHRARPRFESRA